LSFAAPLDFPLRGKSSLRQKFSLSAFGGSVPARIFEMLLKPRLATRYKL
jgi:hypothetical protein